MTAYVRQHFDAALVDALGVESLDFCTTGSRGQFYSP